MRAHIIENGKVVNTIEVDSLDFMPGLVAAVGEEGIGWSYDGNAFSEPPAQGPTIPQVVSKAQGKAALVTAGLWASVLSYVTGIQDATQRALAEIALNDTQEWQRDSQILNAMAFGLNLSTAQLDQLFLSAEGITF